MKKLSLLACLLLLASCSNAGGDSNTSGDSSGSSSGKTTSSETSGDASDDSSEDEPVEPLEVKDGPILHAWDWTTEMVRKALPDIQKAGYKNVQLSPLHPSKDTNANAYWWNLYQPQGFKVATGNENPLGTKDSLKTLTKEADTYGINIIMDVVTNHLGGPNDAQLDKNVKNFEPVIFGDDSEGRNGLIHKNGQVGDWGNRERVVTCAMGGYPDLQTEHSEVQKSVIRMLKEYIDCGVKGFRFDAAKHIETDEDDSRYRSDFWKNVTNAIYTYGEQKLGVTPYVYGEILDNPCIRFEAYTKYISVTDNRQGSQIRNGVKNKNVGDAANTGYNTGDASKTMLWAESHDTYANRNPESKYISNDEINLTYAIQIARKDATALFFARPSQNYENDKAPQVISGATGDYKSALVAAANKLHNDFIGGSETISTSNSAVVNVRKTNKNEGALIADVNCSNTTVTVNVNDLSNGEYTDLITNKKYNVQNGKVNVQLTKGACVLEKDAVPTQSGPTVSITAEETVFKTSTKVTFDVRDADSSSYKINNGAETAFTGKKTITVGADDPDGDIKITVKATNSSGTTTKSITVTKSSAVDKNLIITNVPNDIDIAVWEWNKGEGGSWLTLDRVGSTLAGNITKDAYLLGKFEQGATIDWSTCIAQTADKEKGDKSPLSYDEIVFVDRD